MFESPEKYQPKKTEEEEEKLKKDQKERVEPKELTEQEINYIDHNTNVGGGIYSENIHKKLTAAEARDFFEYNLRKDILTTAWAEANSREIETVEQGGKIYDADNRDNKRKKEIIEDALNDMRAELEEKYSNIIEKVETLSESEEERKEREEEENKISLLERKFRKEFNNAMRSKEKRKEALEDY